MTRGCPATFIVALAASSALTGCASVAPVPPSREESPQSPREAPPAVFSEEAELARAAHVLNRLAFGPRPEEARRVARMGVERWIDQQLRPESIVDSAATIALKGCDIWTVPVETAVATLSGPTRMSDQRSVNGQTVRMISVMGPFLDVVSRDSARKAGLFSLGHLDTGQLLACRMARVEASDQQLVEVMTDFWENHFSIQGNKLPTRGSILEWDRAVIRPNALGRFRTLLGAVAHSPSMLVFLDNALNTAKEPNENYGRELLELHTVGVNGGYTQADVMNVTRAFTGWTHDRVGLNARDALFSVSPVRFVFDSANHDAAEKVVLGHRLPAGRGLEDGEDVLTLLSRHPSTARFIAHKLAVRFVSDVPPDALVDRAAATFLRTDGDIREVVRTIVTSPEFFSPEAYRAKFKSPHELVLSTRRALGAPVDTAAEGIDFLVALEQRPFSKLAPDGWPETAAPWMNIGGMLTRFDIASRIANGEVASIPITSWPAWKTLVNRPFEAQVEGVIRELFSDQVSDATRSALLGIRPVAETPDTPIARERALRELLALALSSPEFQRR
jgi:uncharacterized protein (DUF1800 family)